MFKITNRELIEVKQLTNVFRNEQRLIQVTVNRIVDNYF
jgi:hypothetical protein